MEQTEPSPAVVPQTTIRPKQRVPVVLLFFLLFGLFLLSAWALSANRLEIRSRAATMLTRCWNTVTNQDGELFWPDGCKGSPMTDQSICTEALVPLTDPEQLTYSAWLKAGSQQIAGCVIGAEPPGSDGILTTPAPVACDGPDGSTCTLSSCPKCDGRRCPMIACIEAEGTCLNTVCVQPPVPTGSLTPYPTVVYPLCDGPDGTPCELSTACPVCKPGQPCPAIACDPQEGTCINNRCVMSPVPKQKSSPLSPTKISLPSPTPTPDISHALLPSPSETPVPTPTTVSRRPTPTPIPPRNIAGNRRGGLQNILRFLFPFLFPVLPKP